MNMPNVWKHSSGSALFVLLRHLTRWASKCSILVTVMCTKMALTKKSGCAVTNAEILTTWNVLHLKRKKTSNFPSSVCLMSVGSRRNIKQVVKRVTFSFLVARQKTTQKKVCRGKDGRIIAPRKPASAGYKVKEQKWPASELDRAFDLWEANKTKPKDQQMSKLAISKEVKIPYTTICEQLSGRRGGGKRGKIAGGKRTPRVLDEGKQAGNFSEL